MQAAVLRHASELQRVETRASYLFILPALLLYLVFVLAPVLVTCVLSFTFYDPMLGSRWVGFDNYVRFFTDDRSLQIFWNTLRFTLFAVTGNICVGMLFALALDRKMPGVLLYLFRLAYFLPVIIAAAFVSIVWGYFYGDDLGVINYYLIRLGFSPVHWLTSSRTAMMSIVIMDVWKNAGFFMIIFIAALQGVPKSILEAAVMDGASYWRRFFRIVLPWISPVVFFAIVYASIGALQVFEFDRHPYPRRSGRRNPVDVDPDRRGGVRHLRDRLRGVYRGRHDHRDPRHHRRAVHGLARLGSAMTTQSKFSQRAIDWAIIGVMALLGVFMLLPFAWLFSMSFRTVRDAYQMPPSFLPPRLDLDNYRAVLASSVPFLRIYANSVEVAVLVTVGQLVTCTLAAFAFARLKFPGRDTLFFVMLIGLLFPAQVTIIPIYLGFARVGLLNKPIGLALMYLTSSFGVFLVRQFMRSQPKALEEAALMDGAGYIKIFFRISLPQLRPALAALGIITFTQTWNYYFQARVLLEPQDAMTLPIAMDVLRGYLGSGNLALVMAAMSMSVLPVILLFLLAQRMVIEGVALSGIKT